MNEGLMITFWFFIKIFICLLLIDVSRLDKIPNEGVTI